MRIEDKFITQRQLINSLNTWQNTNIWKCDYEIKMTCRGDEIQGRSVAIPSRISYLTVFCLKIFRLKYA